MELENFFFFLNSDFGGSEHLGIFTLRIIIVIVIILICKKKGWLIHIQSKNVISGIICFLGQQVNIWTVRGNCQLRLPRINRSKVIGPFDFVIIRLLLLSLLLLILLLLLSLFIYLIFVIKINPFQCMRL
jgi:hypothetical protein